MVDHLLPVDETFSSLKRAVCFLGDGRAYHMLPSPLSEDDSDAHPVFLPWRQPGG